MTGEFRAGHGRQRSRTGREDQADATSEGRRGGTECSAGGATLADRRECGLPVEGPRLRAIAMDCLPPGRGLAGVGTLEGKVAGNARESPSSSRKQSAVRRHPPRKQTGTDNA